MQRAFVMMPATVSPSLCFAKSNGDRKSKSSMSRVNDEMAEPKPSNQLNPKRVTDDGIGGVR
jgi:hypothetical protein